MDSIKLGNKEIGEYHPTFIIAEAGVNHNGDIEKAKEMIKEASQMGADAVKFQTFIPELVALPNAPKAEYQIKNSQSNESQLEMISKLALSFDEFQQLYDYSKKFDVEFISTPADEQSAKFLGEFVSIFKVSSADLDNLLLLDTISEFNKPMILSTGMSNLSKIENTIHFLENKNFSNFALLHCTSNYPPKYHELNLRAIITMKSAFEKITGYSDHSLGIEIPISAVTLGARIIEKHFTLDKSLPGPDHKASLEPHEFKQMVSGIRNVEKALGSTRKFKQPSEKEVELSVRKSIVSATNIPVGKVISRDDILAKRPATGISVDRFEEVIGKKAKVEIKKDSIINFSQLI